MKLRQSFFKLLPCGAVIATSFDLGHQLKPGYMNETERPFQLLPGIESIGFLIFFSDGRIRC